MPGIRETVGYWLPLVINETFEETQNSTINIPHHEFCFSFFVLRGANPFGGEKRDKGRPNQHPPPPGMVRKLFEFEERGRHPRSR